MLVLSVPHISVNCTVLLTPCQLALDLDRPVDLTGSDTVSAVHVSVYCIVNHSAVGGRWPVDGGWPVRTLAAPLRLAVDVLYCGNNQYCPVVVCRASHAKTTTSLLWPATRESRDFPPLFFNLTG